MSIWKISVVLLVFVLGIIMAQVPVNSTRLSSPRTAVSSITVGDRVLFVGGYDFHESVASDKIEVFNAINQSWENPLSLPSPRGHVTPVMVDSNIYFLGGISKENPPYIFSTNSFNATERSGPTVRLSKRLSLFNSMLSVIGSYSADFYDLTTGNWSYNSNLTELMTSLDGEIAFGYQDHVFITGGVQYPSNQTSNDAWIYNLTSNELKKYEEVTTYNKTYDSFTYDVSNGVLVVRLPDRCILYHFARDQWFEELNAINIVSSFTLSDITYLFGETYVIHNWTQPNPNPVQPDTNVKIGFVLNGSIIYIMNGILVIEGQGRFGKPDLIITPPIIFSYEWTSDSYVFLDSNSILFTVYESKKDVSIIGGLGKITAGFLSGTNLYLFNNTNVGNVMIYVPGTNGPVFSTIIGLPIAFSPIALINGVFVDPSNGVLPIGDFIVTQFPSSFDRNIVTAQDNSTLVVMKTSLDQYSAQQYKMMDIYNYADNTWTSEPMPDEFFLPANSRFFQETFLVAAAFNDSIMVWIPGVYGIYDVHTHNWTTYNNVSLVRASVPVLRAVTLKDLYFQVPVINGIAYVLHSYNHYLYKFAPDMLTWDKTEPVPGDNTLTILQPITYNDTLFVSIRDNDMVTSLYFYDTSLNQWQLTLLPIPATFVAISTAGDYILAVSSDNNLQIFSILLGQWNTQELDYEVQLSTINHAGNVTFVAGGTMTATGRYSDTVLIISDDVTFIPQVPESSPGTNIGPTSEGNNTGLTVGELVAAIVVPIAAVLGVGLAVLLILLKRKKNQQRTTTVGLQQQFGDWFTPFSDIQFGKQLGQGANGQVFKGTWKSTTVALKVSMTEANQSVISELSLMINLRPHPNVVQLLGFSVHPETNSIILILEYCNGGSLDKQLGTHQMSLSQKVQLLQGIARGVIHLHANNIVHRDLAARNVLLHNDEPKITDFGMSRIVGEQQQRGTTKSELGPIRWMAPESLGNKQYSTKSDVWSFGIVMYEVIAEKEPHAEADPITIGRKIRDEGLMPQFDSSSSDCPIELHSLMKQCWEMSPEQRPEMESVLQKLEFD